MSGTSTSDDRKKLKHKTLRRYDIPGHLRFLTFSCYHQLPLFKNDAIKNVFVQRLAVVRKQQSIGVIAWVIMPEHIHLLIQPKSHDVSMAKILQSIKGPVAQHVILRWRTINANRVLGQITTPNGQLRFWQVGGGYDRNVTSQEEMEEKINYIHQNPVRRGLVERATDWAWSSARWYLGERDSVVIIDSVV